MQLPPTLRQYLPWRRQVFALISFLAVMASPLPAPLNSRAVLAYALAMTVYCAVLLRIVLQTKREEMYVEAHLHSGRSWVPHLIAGVLSIAGVGLLIFLNASMAAESTALRIAHVAVSLSGVVLTWMAMNGTFALRYAAIYYAPLPEAPDQPRRGLLFPDRDLVPDYWDFLYYAFTIGMCYQTSDIALTSPEMRRQTLLHGIFAFLYVCGILSMLFGVVGSFL